MGFDTPNRQYHGGPTSSYNYGGYDTPRSPKITTTFAQDSCDDVSSSTPSSYYQTPPSGSIDDSASLLSGRTTARSPKSQCQFVFDAVSPSHGRKFEYYEPISPDDGALYYDPPSSPRRQGSKKLMRTKTPLDPVPQLTTTGVDESMAVAMAMGGAGGGGYAQGGPNKRQRDEWELPVISKIEARNLSAAAGSSSAGGSYYGLKRDSCVTDCTQLSMESGETGTQHTNSTMVTHTTTSFSFTEPEMEQDAGQPQLRRQRRHAINITSNPGYQVLHSSHSTLDRTCSDSVVSLRYRKSTSDLTQDAEHELSGCKPNKPKAHVEHKPRRRGSSKGGLAYLASRRSSRESMKSACSNASIVSNDDVGPLAFQSSNRGRQRRTSNFLELPGENDFVFHCLSMIILNFLFFFPRLSSRPCASASLFPSRATVQSACQ